MSRKKLKQAAQFAERMRVEKTEQEEQKGTTRDREWDRQHQVAGLRLSSEVVEAIHELSKEYDYSKSDIADALLRVALDAVKTERVSLTFEVRTCHRVSSYKWRGGQVKRAYAEKIVECEFRWHDVDASDGV